MQGNCDAADVITRGKKRYWSSKNNGLCVRCGCINNTGKSRCQECRDKENKELKKTREFRIMMGFCPRCKKNRLFGDEKQCVECRCKNAEEQIRSKEKNREHNNDMQRIWNKNMYNERKENGLCTRCGKKLTDKRYYTCEKCRYKVTEAKRARNGIKPDRKERYKQGLCFFCDNPVKEGYKVCEVHWQKNIEAAHCPKAVEAREKLKKNWG